MFLLLSGKLCSSRQAGRHQFQIQDGLKSISVKYMRQLPSPTAKKSRESLEKSTTTKKWGPKVLPSIVSTMFSVRDLS